MPSPSQQNLTPKMKEQNKQLAIAVQQAKKNKKELKELPKTQRAKPQRVIQAKSNRGIFGWLMGKLYGTNEPPKTVQDTLPFTTMHKDGICQVSDMRFNKTIMFEDINYSLAHSDHQEHILMAYSQFLNFFDANIYVQFTYINRFGNKEEFAKSIEIESRNDRVEYIREEYREMLKSQILKGNNGLVRFKYITFGIDAKDYSDAKPKLERLAVDIENNFRYFGVKCNQLNGEQRLAVLYEQMHPDGRDRFPYDWQSIVESGISPKDAISPDSLEFTDKRAFRLGDEYAAVYHFSITAPEISDSALADFLKMDSAITVNMHITPVNQTEAIKLVKRKVTDLDSQKIDGQKKANRDGYDMALLSAELMAQSEDVKDTLTFLQSRNERMYMITFTLLMTAKTKKELDTIIFSANNIAQKHNCQFKPLDYQQEQGFCSSLTVGNDEIEIDRMLLTTSLAIFVPFTISELFLKGQALYYGLNRMSNNLIMGNRKMLKNPNGLILGTPGSGKSFAAKREIVNAFLITNDDVIIVDPEGEYFPLVKALGGQIIKLSTNSPHCVNPMEIDFSNDDEDDPISMKSQFIISMMELVASSKGGLSNKEISLIDRCVKNVYREYMKKPDPENMPILEDLLNELNKQDREESENLAIALELYVTGSQNMFNNRTNVDINNRLVCFDIKELGAVLKNIAMLILQEAVWSRVSKNREAKKNTWYYIDEFHLLLREERTASYSVAIWKRFRKWGGIPTGITQNVKDLLASREIQNIFENSDFILMLNQAGGDRTILAAQLGISESQLGFVTQSGAGEGLIFHGDTIIPFRDQFPKDTQLYKIMTTKPDEQ